MKICITGGAGFIGSAVVRHLINDTDYEVLNLDKLTYAGNLDSLATVENSPRYNFFQTDVCDRMALDKFFAECQPDIVMHLAAESHVDRSIESPGEFLATNINGTYNLLESLRGYLQTLSGQKRELFRFLHISTDEVFGDLGEGDDLFTENTPYAPSSPYAASKASSDHLVRAWYRTYNLPIIITNCSNNYGPYQFPEKLIPHMILNGIKGKPMPVYGQGNQIRDWLHVDDHARALVRVVTEARVGETYNIGGVNEIRNIEVVESLCELLEELNPHKPDGVENYRDLIAFVDDRPGHDTRYAINADKIGRDIGWQPQETFNSGLRKTVVWYLANSNWWQRVLDGDYRLDRIGLS